MRLARTWCALALVGVMAVAGGAVAQEDAAAPAKTALALTAKKGDTLEFRRSFERTAVCEALGRDGDETQTMEYAVTVKSVGDDGSLGVEIVFGEATGHLNTPGGKKEFDTAQPLPEIESMRHSMELRARTLLAGATVQATLNAHGKVVEVEGVKEAVAAAFADTPLAEMVADYPDDEARAEIQAVLPGLPDADQAREGAWADKRKIDFGASSKFGYDHKWRVGEPKDGAVSITATCKHATAPEGQKNEGTGIVMDKRSSADGFVQKRTVNATFKGEGKFEIAAKYKETIERLPAKE